MTDIGPIPCHACGKPAAWSDVRRRWRCASNHVTSELWAAAHELGPFAPQPAPLMGALDAADRVAP